MPTAVDSGIVYVFEEFRLEPETRILLRADGEQIRLANRPFQVLLYLIENRGRLVRRDELLERFWDGRDVYDTALTKAVGAIRRSLEENPENPLFIETRWAEGYRFIGKIEEQSAFQPSFVEIEKTREVRFVIEETDTLFDAQTRRRGDAVKDSSNKPESEISNLKLPAKNIRVSTLPRLRAVSIAVCMIFVLALGAFVFSRYQQSKPAPIRSIAVLPFKNLSSNPNTEIFNDGVTESLISSLSKIEGLKVISRNSVSIFKDKDADPREIAEKLGVEAFLEGSVRETNGRLLVEIRLVNAKTGEILWSGDDEERPSGDILKIQEEVAQNVATRLRLKLTGTDEQRLARRQTDNVEAYQAYVKGRYFWKKKDRESLEKARKFFEEAVRLDPNYALAYAGLADYYLSGIWSSIDFPYDEALKNAKAAVAKLSEIDDQMSETHKLRATIAGIEWDWETCRRESEKAVELNPNDANNWHTYAFVLRNLEARYDEAVAAIKKAQELDPLSPSVNTDVGVMLTHAGRLDEAIEAFKKTLEAEPKFADAYWNLGLAYQRKGMDAEAFAAFVESDLFLGKSEQRIAAYRAAFAQGGLKLFWQKALEFVEAEAREKKLPDYYLAVFYARAGDGKNAFKKLEKSYAVREPYLMNLKSDFAFDGLRSDPRFTDLLRRVGLQG